MRCFPWFIDDDRATEGEVNETNLDDSFLKVSMSQGVGLWRKRTLIVEVQIGRRSPSVSSRDVWILIEDNAIVRLGTY